MMYHCGSKLCIPSKDSDCGSQHILQLRLISFHSNLCFDQHYILMFDDPCSILSMINDFGVVHKVIQFSMPVLFSHGKCPQRISSCENACRYARWIGRIFGMNETMNEDFVDRNQWSVDVFLLLFHISNDLSKIFSIKVGAPRNLGNARKSAHGVDVFTQKVIRSGLVWFGKKHVRSPLPNVATNHYSRRTVIYRFNSITNVSLITYASYLKVD